MDAADPEPPGLQLLHQVVESIPELGKEKEALVGPVEEPFLLHDSAKMSELGLRARPFHRSGLLGKLQKLGDLFPDLACTGGQGDRLQHPFQALALGVLELLQLFQARKVRRRLLRQVRGALQAVFQAPGAVFE